MYYFQWPLGNPDHPESMRGSIQGVIKTETDETFILIDRLVEHPQGETPEVCDSLVFRIPKLANNDYRQIIGQLREALIALGLDQRYLTATPSFSQSPLPPLHNSVVSPYPYETIDLKPKPRNRAAASPRLHTELHTESTPLTAQLNTRAKIQVTGGKPWLSELALGVSASVAVVIVGAGLWQVVTLPPEMRQLDRAEQLYYNGNLDAAIALVANISPDNPYYTEIQTTIDTWQQTWQAGEELIRQIDQAVAQQQWQAALDLSLQLPELPALQARATPYLEVARLGLEADAQLYLSTAFDRARSRNFNDAITYLEKIPPNTTVYRHVAPKLKEYRHKQEIRAAWQLQQAYNLAQMRDFHGAIAYLENIPPSTTAYTHVQAKLALYRDQQNIRATWQLQQAYNLAMTGEFAAAIEQLQTIPPDTTPYAIAQQKQQEYQILQQLSTQS